MIEIHVDEVPENIVKKKANLLLTEIFQQRPFGGSPSIWMAAMEKPLSAQFIFTGKAWKGTKGKLAIIPKDEGNGIMVSAMQS